MTDDSYEEDEDAEEKPGTGELVKKTWRDYDG